MNAQAATPKTPKLRTERLNSYLGGFGDWELGVHWELGVVELGIDSELTT
jgi:hypothetical protein